MSKKNKKSKMSKMSKAIVAYTDGDEVIVCAIDDEKAMLKEWFNGGDRELDQYDRVHGSVLVLKSECSVFGAEFV